MPVPHYKAVRRERITNLNNNAAQGGPGPSSIPGAPQNGQQAGDGDNSDSDQAVQNGPQNGFGAQNSRGPGGLSQANQTGPGNGNGPTFGGLPIVGVASTSKDKTIREFNKKDHYNQWQFIYDPSTDRGGLLTTPESTPAARFGAAEFSAEWAAGEQWTEPTWIRIWAGRIGISLSSRRIRNSPTSNEW